MVFRHSPFAGDLLDRDVELKVLHRTLAELVCGQSSVIVVHGPPGAGRTALARRADAMAGVSGVTVLRAIGSVGEHDTDLGLVSQLMAPLLTPDSAVWDVLRSGGDTATVRQLLREFLVLARKSPLLVLVDDAHWADPASVRWLQGVARRVRDTPMVLLLTVSSGSDLRVPAAHVLRLAPLAEATVGALLKREFPDGVDETFTQAVLTETGGNPAVLRTTLSRLATMRVPATADGIRQLREVAAEARSDLVRRTIDGLPGDLVRLLRAIAICGSVLEFDLVCVVAGLQARSMAAARDQLHRVGLVTLAARPELSEWVSADRVLGGMPVPQREAMHAAAARLGHRSAASDDGVATILLGTKPIGEPWAVEVLRTAAASQGRLGDLATAARMLTRASREPADPLTAAGVLVELGEIELQSSQQAAERHLGQVITGPGGPEVAHLRVRAADLLFSRGSEQRVYQLTGEAYRSCDLGEPPCPQLIALYWLAEDGAGRAGPDGPDPLPDWPDEPAQSGVLAWQLAKAGRDRERSTELARRALRTPDRTPAIVRVMACYALALADETDEAVIALEELLGELRSPGDRVVASLALAARSDIAARQNDPATARQVFASAADLTPADGWPAFHSPTMVGGRILRHLDEGEVEAARELAESGPAAAVTQGLAWPSMLYAHGQVKMATGQYEQAVDLLLECGRQLEARHAHNPAVLPWRSVAVEALRACGRIDQAENLLATERRLAVSWGAPSVLARVERLTGG